MLKILKKSTIIIILLILTLIQLIIRIIIKGFYKVNTNVKKTYKILKKTSIHIRNKLVLFLLKQAEV